MGTSRPATSSNPEDATFSYQSEDNSLRGPFCWHCMNRWSEFFAANVQMGVYLHYKSKAKFFRLEELQKLNGNQKPFTLSALDEEVRKNPCYYDKCLRSSGGSAATSPGLLVVPPPTVTVIIEKKVVQRVLPRENPSYVINQRPVEFPLLYGTCYAKCCALNEDQWSEQSARSLELYSAIAHHKQAVKDAFDILNWRTPNCDVCEYIDPDEPYVEHVLSRTHFQNILSRGRKLTAQHFDIFNTYLKKVEKAIRDNGQMNFEKKTTLQQYPLLAMWHSRNEKQMTRGEYDKRLDYLASLIKSVDYNILNSKNHLEVTQEVCYFCGTWINNMSGLINHIVGKEHRDYLFDRTNVSAADIDGYIRIVKNSMVSNPRESRPVPNPAPVSSTSSLNESNLLQLPFVTGYDRPSDPLTKDEAISIGGWAKKLINGIPPLKSKLNAVLFARGQCLLKCSFCDKRFPAAVSVLEHSVSPAHMTTLMDLKLQFSKLYDYVPLVTIFLDALNIKHPIISSEKVEHYKNMIKVPGDDKKDHGLPQSQGEKIVPVKISKLEEVAVCPFLVPRSTFQSRLGEVECLALTKPLRTILCENDKVRKAVMSYTDLKNVKCFVCDRVFNSPFQTYEHVVAAKHINLTYEQKMGFCRVDDYLEIVRVMARAVDKTLEVTLDNVTSVVASLEIKPKLSTNPNSRTNRSDPSVNGTSSSHSSRPSSTTPSASNSNPPPKVQRCKMTQQGRCLKFMNKTSTKGDILTDEQLFTICEIVRREICGGYKCYISAYDKLQGVCPTNCPICEYRPLGCCDYVIHLFEGAHYNKLLEAKVAVSTLDVQFWMEQLVQLRIESLKLPPPEENIIEKCWNTIGISPVIRAPSIPSLSQTYFL